VAQPAIHGWSVGAVLGSWVVLTAGGIDLRPKFERGSTVHYTSRSTIRHEVHVPEADIAVEINLRIETGMTLTVREAGSQDVAEVEWRLDYVVLLADGAIPGIDGLLDYDSRDPGRTKSPLAALFDRIVGHPVTLRVDPSGTVLEFRGLDAGTGTDIPSVLARGFFSKQAFEQLPLFVTGGAPTPAKVRATWSRATTLDMPLGVGALEMAEDFKFVRLQPLGKTALLQMTGRITKSTAQAGAAGGLLPGVAAGALTVNSGTLAGQYTWDYPLGQLVSAETTLKLETSLQTPLGRMQLVQDMTSAVVRTKPEGPPRPSKAPPRTPAQPPRTRDAVGTAPKRRLPP